MEDKWVVKFAWRPILINDEWIWLERYKQYQHKHIIIYRTYDE